MELVEYQNVIKVMRRDITYLSDDLITIAKQLESAEFNLQMQQNSD